jgi:hypothetical protein
MRYEYFKVIGLQRSGTNWINQLILHNFYVNSIPKYPMYKHLTPLGIKRGALSEARQGATDLKNLKLRDDMFFIGTQKPFNVWRKSIGRNSRDFYSSHNFKDRKTAHREVWDSWDQWKNSKLHKQNFYFKPYLSWLDNWPVYLAEIEQLTGWKRKHNEFQNVRPADVPKSGKNFRIERYKKGSK